MSATPTARPWTANKILYPAGQDVSFEVKAGRRLIAQTIMREVIREDDAIAVDEANARLIVTAVNHHEDLLEIVRALDGCIVPPAIAIKARQLLARLDGAEREPEE